MEEFLSEHAEWQPGNQIHEQQRAHHPEAGFSLEMEVAAVVLLAVVVAHVSVNGL